MGVSSLLSLALNLQISPKRSEFYVQGNESYFYASDVLSILVQMILCGMVVGSYSTITKIIFQGSKVIPLRDENRSTVKLKLTAATKFCVG